MKSVVSEPLGDKLFAILIIAFATVFIVGWIVLLTTMCLQWIFPSLEDRLEKFLKYISGPFGFVQKFSGYGALILIAIRFIAGLLGWGPPIPLGEE